MDGTKVVCGGWWWMESEALRFKYGINPNISLTLDKERK
jgi:hypothetical protein